MPTEVTSTATLPLAPDSMQAPSSCSRRLERNPRELQRRGAEQNVGAVSESCQYHSRRALEGPTNEAVLPDQHTQSYAAVTRPVYPSPDSRQKTVRRCILLQPADSRFLKGCYSLQELNKKCRALCLPIAGQTACDGKTPFA